MDYLGEIMEEDNITKCYSYKIEMIVQVLSTDEKAAREQLDQNGGHVSGRIVTLMDSVPLFSGDGNEKA